MEVTGGIDCGGCGDGSWGGDEGDDSVESTAGADEEAAAAAWQQSGRDPTCDDTRVVLRRCGRAVARAAWAHRPQVISVCATGAIRRALAMVGTQAHLLRRSSVDPASQTPVAWLSPVMFTIAWPATRAHDVSALRGERHI